MLLSASFLACLMACSVLARISQHRKVSKGCGEEQKSREGDWLAVHYKHWDSHGTLLSNTQGGQPHTFYLGQAQPGQGQPLPGLDEVLGEMCAGDVVEVVVPGIDGDERYLLTVEVITRTVRAGKRNGKGVLVRKEGKCRDKKVVKAGDTVTLKTVARIPNYLYLHYPHPTGNTPVRVRVRGIPGVKIDTSQDTIRTGEGNLVPGWEMGILGACEGETRMIMIGPNLAFGAAGVYQVVPPREPLALRVEVVRVERDKVDTFLQQ